MLLVRHDSIGLVPFLVGEASAPPPPEAPTVFPKSAGDIAYAVGRYVFLRNDVWLTAIDSRSGVQLWSRRFERHLRILREQGGSLLLLVLREGELRLLDVNVSSGAEREVARLGFAALDLADKVFVHRNVAYVSGPSRVVAVDLNERKLAWETRIRADRVFGVVGAGDELFAAWSCDGRAGMQTTIARLERANGAVEERARMAASCRGFIGNDVAVFARLDAARGVLPFGHQAVAAFPANGVGEPLLIPGAGQWAASGRYFLMVNGERADLVSHDGRALACSEGRLVGVPMGPPRIVGDRAYVNPRGAPIDLRALAKRPTLPRERVRGLLDAQPSGSKEPAAPPASSPRVTVASAPLWLPKAPSRADEDLHRLPPGLMRVFARASSGEAAWRLSAVGLKFVDPRGHWSARPGRDPSLVDFAQRDDGCYLCVYDYPMHRGELPVVDFSPASGRVTYLAPDFESFLADYLDHLAEATPGAVEIAGDLLTVTPEPLARVDVPEWFQAAHGVEATWDFVAAAHQRGDELARERLLVGLARDVQGHDLDRIRDELDTVYRGLGWTAHRDDLRRWNPATMSTH